MRSAVKQTALTSGRGGDGELRLIAGLLWPCRSSLLRKSFQGDVLFSLVLQTTLLFKQHRGGKKKRGGKTHFFHFELVVVCEGGLGGWGAERVSAAISVCVEVARLGENTAVGAVRFLKVR